ncbi:retrovirus-related pol polyprotein from transposon TNT 1-94 [Tanacetum coccineum]
MHNNIMAASSNDRPPMLATGRYAQSLHTSTITIPAVPATDDSPEFPERIAVETILNMSPENKAYYESEKEAIHLLLTGIGDEIYSTVDACKTAHEIWIAIKRLQQGESLNIQDVKTNLFWEFGKFTSHDEESMESYYSRFYKMMNEMIRNNLTVATMQYQKKVNEICAERIAKNANLLVLVATAQQYPDPYYQAPKSHKSYAPPSKQSSSTRSNASTKYKGKEITKPITPPSESASEEDSDPEQAQRDKDMHKNLALITSKRSTNLPTTTSKLLQTLETRMWILLQGSQVVQQTGIQCFNCKEFGHFAKECRKPKRVKDYSYHKEKMLLCKHDEKGVPLQAEQVDWLADTDEEIDEQELEAHYNYMAKIQEVPTTDSGTDTEPLEHVKYDAEYNVFANERQHSEQPESISNICVVEKVDSNVIPDSLDMCDNDIQTDQNVIECDDTLVALANLICKSILAETSRTLGESNSIRDSCLIALQNKQTELETYKTLNDHIIDYDKLERKLNETLGLLAQKEIDIKEGLKLKAYEILVVKEKHDELVKQSHITKDIVWEKLSPIGQLTAKQKSTVLQSKSQRIDELGSDKAEFSNMYDILLQEYVSNDVMCSYFHSLSDLDGHTELQCLYLHKVKEYESRQAVRNKNVIKPSMYRIDTRTTQTRAPQLPHTSRNTNPRVSNSTGVIHITNVSRPQLRSTQMKDKDMPNNSQVKFKKTEVEDHHRISSISKKTLSVTACNDNLKSKTLNVNVVCASCGKCVFNLNHDACVSKILNDVNARTKKPKVVPISARKPKS